MDHSLKYNCLCGDGSVDDETEPGVGRAEDPLRQGCEDCTGKRPKSGGFKKGEKLHQTLMKNNFALCVHTFVKSE